MNSKFLIFNFFVLFYCYSYSQELVTYYYSDSTISAQGYMRNGKPDGYWKNYYPSGIVKSEGKRTNFELDSIWKFYSEQGFIQSEISYFEGKKNGEFKEYIVENDSIYLYSITMYVNDIKHGKAYFYSKGTLQKIIPFEQNKQQGQSFEFDVTGEISAIVMYKNNEVISKQSINRTNVQGEKQGTWMEFYPNGNVKTEANYSNGKLQGLYKLFNSRQELLQVGNYDADSLVYASQIMDDFEEPFEKREWYNNSILKFKGTYKDIVPIGVHRFYNEKGEIVSGLLYNAQGTIVGKGITLENGKKQGAWIFYYPDGTKESEGLFSNNEKTGLWKFYYPSGTIKQEGSFTRNKISGFWKWYSETGVLRKEEQYAGGKKNGLSIQYNEQKQIIVQGEYIDDKQHGVWIYKTGDIITKAVYEYGDKTKTWESHYSSNGKLQYKGSYYMGQPKGKHLYYYNNGKLDHEEIYKNGKPAKAWSYYSYQGELLYVVYYKKGVEDKIVTVSNKHGLQ